MIISPLLGAFFLLGSSLMTGLSGVIQRLGKTEVEALSRKGLARFLFKKSKRDQLTYCISITKRVSLIAYSLTALGYAFSTRTDPVTLHSFLIASITILAVGMVTDYISKALSLLCPKAYFNAAKQLCSLFLIVLWPLSVLLFKLLKLIRPRLEQGHSIRIKDKILEILHDSEFAPYLDPQDQKLILSVVSFKERIAREIMVPRIDMTTLDAEISIKEAAKSFLAEGYSRIPVWKESVDNIIGALYYKDLLNVYFSHSASQKELSTPIETLIKPIVYTPETKQISILLQEFRVKQIHLAIVVDEYGGTEGIVTIEDILEELVGEIADEYDETEEALFSVLPSGEWIVDAKMTILDIEDQLGIQIPHSAEYDSVGGYIFHKAGAIPSKGWKIHQDAFDIEVLSSSERAIEKIRITPH